MTPAIRRILTAIDASPLSLAAVDAACALAARLGAACDAVHVEDVNLARLVAHPQAHTPVDDDTLEKALQLQQAKARQAHERAIAAHGIGGIFSVRRGRVTAELLEAAPAADLLCLGWSGRARPGRDPRLGSTARRLLSQPPRPVLALRHAACTPVMALWDGSPAARRALTLAARLAGGMPVELLIPDNDPMAVVRLAAEAEDFLAVLGASGRHRSAGRLLRCLAGAGTDGMLVAAAGLPLDDISCSVVAVP